MEAERYFGAESLESEIEKARRNRVRGDIARRLERACAHLGQKEFRDLVDKMTERQLEGERRLTREFLP